MKPSEVTRKKLFGRAAAYFPLLDQIMPRTLTHRYSFVSDEWFRNQIDAEALYTSDINHFVVLDLLEKTHLTAVTTIIRTIRWADATCLMFDAQNFPGFASALRGLIENGGDSIDSLLNVAGSVAANHRNLAEALQGNLKTELINCAEIERMLDHYVHARWTGKKHQSDPVFTAKANAEYVRLIEQCLPGAVSLYHRLCAIVHPSSTSINWIFEFDEKVGNRLKLSTNDASRIAALCEEFPDVADVTIQVTCNAALITLRVLHKFPLHPKIPELKNLNWSEIRMANEIEKLLHN